MFPNVKYCYSLSITWISLARVEFPLPSALFMCLVFVCCAERHLPWTGISCVTTSPPIGDQHYRTFLWGGGGQRHLHEGTTINVFAFNSKHITTIPYSTYSMNYHHLDKSGRFAWPNDALYPIYFEAKHLNGERHFLVIYLGLASDHQPLSHSALYLDEQITNNKPRNSYPYVWLAVFVSSSCLAQ